MQMKTLFYPTVTEQDALQSRLAEKSKEKASGTLRKQPMCKTCHKPMRGHIKAICRPSENMVI